MGQAVAIGPFIFSVPSLLVFGSVALGYVAGNAANRARDVKGDGALLTALVVALLASRATYVIEWFDAYRQHPIEIVDIRDGGWNLPLGLLFAAIGVMAVGRRGGPGRSTPNRRPAFIAIGVAMATFLAGSATAHRFGPPLGRDVTSSILLSSLDGQAVGVAHFNGRPTVLNLWATWCGPCRRELPMLTEAQGANPDVNFVFANQGEDVALVNRYFASAGFKPTNVLLDAKSELARASDAQGWPTTLFLNAAGQLIASDTGELTANTLSKRLAQLRTGKTD